MKLWMSWKQLSVSAMEFRAHLITAPLWPFTDFDYHFCLYVCRMQPCIMLFHLLFHLVKRWFFLQHEKSRISPHAHMINTNLQIYSIVVDYPWIIWYIWIKWSGRYDPSALPLFPCWRYRHSLQFLAARPVWSPHISCIIVHVGQGQRLYNWFVMGLTCTPGYMINSTKHLGKNLDIKFDFNY